MWRARLQERTRVLQALAGNHRGRFRRMSHVLDRGLGNGKRRGPESMGSSRGASCRKCAARREGAGGAAKIAAPSRVGVVDRVQCSGPGAGEMITRHRSRCMLAIALCTAACGSNDALHGRIRASSSDFALARGTDTVTREELGLLRLMFDDLGGLRIANDRGSALPWKALVAA